VLLSQFLLVTLSALLHAAWNFYAKKTPQKLEIITLGLGLSTAFFFPGIFFEELPSATGVALTLATGFVQAVYVALLYRAYRVATLTLVYPLSRGLAVMATFLIGTLIAPHALSGTAIAGVLVITVGTSCLAFPHLRGAERQGVHYSIGIGVLLSVAFVLSKVATPHVSAFTFLWGMYAASFFFLVPFLGRNFRSRFRDAYRVYRVPAAVMGIGSYVSYLLVIYLFKTMPAATVVAARETSVVFGAIFGFVYLREKVTPLKVFSILAIVVGTVLLKLG